MLVSDSKIHEYCIQKSNRPSKICKELENYTKNNVPYSQMLIGELEASLLSFLLRSIKAKSVLEFGTFTGYSALCMAEHLPDDGFVITLDINPETVEIAKELIIYLSFFLIIEDCFSQYFQCELVTLFRDFFFTYLSNNSL